MKHLQNICLKEDLSLESANIHISQWEKKPKPTEKWQKTWTHFLQEDI